MSARRKWGCLGNSNLTSRILCMTTCDLCAGALPCKKKTVLEQLSTLSPSTFFFVEQSITSNANFQWFFNSSSATIISFQKPVARTFPADLWIRNCLYLRVPDCFHSINCFFISESQKCTQLSSTVLVRLKKSALFSNRAQIFLCFYPSAPISLHLQWNI